MGIKVERKPCSTQGCANKARAGQDKCLDCALDAEQRGQRIKALSNTEFDRLTNPKPQEKTMEKKNKENRTELPSPYPPDKGEREAAAEADSEPVCSR